MEKSVILLKLGAVCAKIKRMSIPEEPNKETACPTTEGNPQATAQPVAVPLEWIPNQLPQNTSHGPSTAQRLPPNYPSEPVPIASSDIDSWLGGAGDSETLDKLIERVWNQHFAELVRFAQSRLGGIRRGSYDEEDIALSAIKSLYRGIQAGRLHPHLPGDDIWKLLVVIALRKISAQRRRLLAAKRVGERTESAFGLQANDSASGFAIDQVWDHRQTLESSDALSHACAEMIQQLTDDRLQTTALLRLEGYSNREIAEQMNCSVSIIKQRIQRIRKLWQRSVEP